MILVYPCRNVMFFKFLFIHKRFFARVCFLILIFALPGKTSVEKSDDTNWRKFHAVLFLFYFGILLLCAKIASLETMLIYVDFQSRVKDPIHIIILMKSIISLFILSFYDLTVVYEQERSNNNM